MGLVILVWGLWIATISASILLDIFGHIASKKIYFTTLSAECSYLLSEKYFLVQIIA